MFVPKDVLLVIFGYILCPITAYLYILYKEYKEKKRIQEERRKRMEDKNV